LTFFWRFRALTYLSGNCGAKFRRKFKNLSQTTADGPAKRINHPLSLRYGVAGEIRMTKGEPANHANRRERNPEKENHSR